MIFNQETIPQTQDDEREVVIRRSAYPLMTYNAQYLDYSYPGYYLVRDFVADAVYRALMDSVEIDRQPIVELYYLKSRHSRAYELSHEMILRCANAVASEIHNRISHDKFSLYAIDYGSKQVDCGLAIIGFKEAVVGSLIDLG